MERTVVPPHLARCRNSSTCDLLLATLEPLRLMGCTTLLSRWAEQAGRTACMKCTFLYVLRVEYG